MFLMIYFNPFFHTFGGSSNSILILSALHWNDAIFKENCFRTTKTPRKLKNSSFYNVFLSNVPLHLHFFHTNRIQYDVIYAETLSEPQKCPRNKKKTLLTVMFPIDIFYLLRWWNKLLISTGILH